MLQTMLESLVSEKKKSIRFDISEQYIPELEQYFSHTFFYPVLLHFNRACAMLSCGI